MLLLEVLAVKTGEPLSPPATPAFTVDWQSCVMVVPETLMLTQVEATEPRVQPVVRPILLTVWPVLGELAVAVMVKRRWRR